MYVEREGERAKYIFLCVTSVIYIYIYIRIDLVLVAGALSVTAGLLVGEL